MGGAERVVAAMHRRFPHAPIYTSAVNRRTLWSDFSDADIRTTWLQHAPFIGHHTHFKKYLPLYPAAFSSFGTIDTDVAWISSSTFAKYLRFSPRTHSVCYIHNPTRFLWQTDEYVDHEVRHPLLRRLVHFWLPFFRRIDLAAARRMRVLVANSRNVQKRVLACYHRDALIIHPPVQTDRFQLTPPPSGKSFYLIVSRLLGYKNIDLAVRAFSASSRPLVIVGEGPHRSVLERIAGPTVRFAGRLSEEETRAHFESCRALIFPGDEDFGITPVEAMACGRPVIALGRGGALETILDGETGILFSSPSEENLLAALTRAEATSWDSARIRAHAEQFSEQRFLDRMEAVLRPSQ